MKGRCEAIQWISYNTIQYNIISEQCNTISTATPDCPRKLWRLGARQELPAEWRDWQMPQGRNGGGYRKRGGFHVKKSFLKKVVLDKFRHRLRFSVCLATQSHLSICMLSLGRIGFV